MEKLIWLLSFIPARIVLAIISLINVILFENIYQRGILQGSLFSNSTFILIAVSISTIACIVSAIVGGKIGYNYVEMFRSKHWHYHSTRFYDISTKVKNMIYWAGKFACISLILIESLLLLFVIIFMVL